MKFLHAASAGSAVSDRSEGFGRETSQDFLSLLAEASGNAAETGMADFAAAPGPGCAAQMLAFFRGLSERVDLATFEVRDFAARGAEVLSFGTFSGRLREGHGAVAADWAIHWRVEAGRLRMRKAFVDSFAKTSSLAV